MSEGDFMAIEEERTGLAIKKIRTKEEKEHVMNLAREYVNIPEIRKDILEQVKHQISGKA